jgi:hypothetical protein
MYIINKFTSSFALMSFQQGTRYYSLVRQSTTTYIASQLFDHRRPFTKSIDMSCQGLYRIGRGHNILNVVCLLSFVH